MARLDPLRNGGEGQLVNDDEQSPQPVITQCEGMQLAFDPAGQPNGRQFDPLTGGMRRTRPGIQVTLRLALVGPTWQVYGTVTGWPETADLGDYTLASDNPLGLFDTPTGNIQLDGLEYQLSLYAGSAGDTITLEVTFPDTSIRSDQKTT